MNEEIVELKKQLKQIQQRIDDLEEIEEQKNKSLHNLIAKWEFYYSERLEKRILYADSTGKTCSYRDIIEEEIENLLSQIEEWLDYQTYLIENSGIHYIEGWNDCIQSLKNRLRGPYDWYEFHKINKEFNE